MDCQRQKMFLGFPQKSVPFGGGAGDHEQLADGPLVAAPRCRQHPASVDRGILPVDAGRNGQGYRKGVVSQGETRCMQGGFGGKAIVFLARSR